MQTPEEQLAEIQQAISDIVTGAQEAWYNGQKIRKADLTVLEKRESTLLRRLRRKNTGGIRVRNITPYE
jgi:hypothetical protein